MAEAKGSNREWIRKTRGDTCVIFVHGILSSAEQCWRHEKGPYWPALLAEERGLEEVGILAFSYRSDVFCHNYNVGDIVRSLREILDLEKLLDSKRIIFVCHSMGGIVVRRFLVKEQAYLIPRQIEFGVFLIASPSLGSRDANTLSMFARVVGNSQAEVLRFSESNQWLNDLDNDFMDLKEAGILKIKGRELVEDEPIKIKKWFGFRTQLVEPFAAARYFARPLKIDWSDHSSIAKPANARALQHEVLCKFIKEMLHAEQEVAPEHIRPEEIHKAIHLFQELEKKLNDVKAERYHTALTKVAHALHRTELYLRHRGTGGKRDVESEHELSELWEDVGYEIQQFDPKLADFCFVKGHVWADEIIWSDPKYKKLPSRLHAVVEKIIRSIEKERERTVLEAVSYTSTLQIDVYDGTRQLLAPGKDILYRLIDGNQKQIFSQFQKTSSLLLKRLPFYDNFGDNYTVIASADDYSQAGFTPVKLSPTVDVKIDLMLLPKNSRFDFSMASWDTIKLNMPFLASGADDATGRARYEDLMQNDPMTLAALLNILTMLRQIRLPKGTPLTYLKQAIWEDMPERNIYAPRQDRFYAYADNTLVSQIQLAAQRGEFAPVLDPLTFHKGATSSYKQIQFGEANVQLTFHEGETQIIDGTECVVVEPDIDYYKDLAAHTLSEVIANALTGSVTDPRNVYELRWIAGRRDGVPEFNPPYTIVA